MDYLQCCKCNSTTGTCLHVGPCKLCAGHFVANRDKSTWPTVIISDKSTEELVNEVLAEIDKLKKDKG